MSVVNALGVFVRMPEKGKVKTRLAATMGEEKALAVYISLLSHTLSTVSEIRAPITLFYEGGLPSSKERNSAFEYCPQITGTLTEKLSHAFELLLTKTEKAVIIGSDCPDISSTILQESFSTLNTHDIVIGPATDGGFYLLGLKKFNQHLFDNIEWSSSTVLSQITSNMVNSKLTFKLLETLSDIDIEKDWKAYKKRRCPDENQDTG